ncbi:MULTISPECIES: polysaccharide biosynthesis protein [unclassified Moraxella]|uniref:polysaccharide biosynthesis protein n=1 Tax=unclassified Moraxella TaxID=2685852 RepID=UPI003AF460D8
MLDGKTLLITGGTGSFGNTMIDGFLDSSLKEIRIFSRDEKKQEDMRIAYKNDKLNFVLGDVRNFNDINQAMYGVDFVFHAAALKQVPSCEFYPMQAVQTNILGADNVLEACIQNQVKRVVVLSTDKAVHPVNTMGMSKAMMEKITIAKSRDPRVKAMEAAYAITRYGNVMCSRGSVIPLFINQIKKGLPLTITNPNMTRFMMSLDESVDLVLFAFTNANPGDTFVQKSPAATIGVLAEALKQLFNSDSEIQIIGSRHGEKMHETLCSKQEMSKAEDMGNFFRIPADLHDLNYAKYVREDKGVEFADEYNSHNTRLLNVEELKELLMSLEFVRDEIRCN